METNEIVIEAEMVEKIRNTIAEVLCCDKEAIALESDIAEDLGADSLDRVSIIMALEDAFKQSVPGAVALQLATVGDIVRYVSSRKKSTNVAYQ
jgi:acyl carrier protein